MAFLASVKILAEGGKLEAYPERIYAERADAMTFIVAAATSFRANDYRADVERALSTAAATPYEKLKADHIADHRKLFRRVGLTLGTGQPDPRAGMPTDERLARVQRGETDLGLEVALFPASAAIS